MSQENNFVPNQQDYKPLSPFRLFVKSNFPFIENTFEALDNYGLYCKIVEYLNTVIENENTVESNVTALYNSFVSLNTYVSDYFDNLDVQEEINNKLDEMAESGQLQNIIGDIFDNLQQQINSLASGSPLVASSTSEMTDTSKIYVNTTDGYWYFYNGTTWTTGGVYQGTEISPTNKELDGRNSQANQTPFYLGYEKFNFINNIVNGAIVGDVGEEISFNTSTTRCITSEGNPLTPGHYRIINIDNTVYSFGYTKVDSNGIVTGAWTGWKNDKYVDITLSSSEYAYLQLRKTNNTAISISEAQSNFRILGNPIDYKIPKLMCLSPILIDTYERTITIPANSIISNTQENITIANDVTISYTQHHVIKKLIYKTVSKQFEVLRINEFPNENSITLGHFINTTYNMEYCDIPNYKLYNSMEVQYPNIKNIYDIELANYNVTSNGIEAFSSSRTRVSTKNYIHGIDGKLVIYNNNTSGYKYGFQTFSYDALTNTYTRINDSGWITSHRYVANLNKNYYHLLFFAAANGTDYIKVKDIYENFYIENGNSGSIISPKIPNFCSVGHQGNGANTLGTRGNSLQGFINGALHGYDELEADVIVTSDGVIVMNHDETITDDSSNTYTIAETTYSELSSHLYGGLPICTFEDYMKTCKQYGCRARIDHLYHVLQSDASVYANFKDIILKYAMAKYITITIGMDQWTNLLTDFPECRLILSNVNETTKPLNDTLVQQVRTYQSSNPKASFGITLDITSYNNDTTKNFIKNYNDVWFEFYTIDDLSVYKNLQPLCSAITSNRYTAYDSLL